MPALILDAPGKITLRQMPIPEPGPGELLVRVMAATTCGTDLKAFQRGHPQIPMPGPFGHEYSGEVCAAGEGAPFSVGQAIMGVHSAPCQTCFWCAQDQENLCEHIMATKVLGSYAEYLLIPAHIARLNVFEKPDHLNYTTAALLEPLACVAQGIQALGTIDPGSRILIIGPGAIGLMFVAALRHNGLFDVTLAGRNQDRLAIGERLGARTMPFEEIFDGIGRGYDIVIECTGKVEVWQASLHMVRRGGKLVLFGGCPAGSLASFDTGRIHYDQITLLSPFHFGTKAVRSARSWLVDESFDLSPLITSERPLADAESVFRDLERGTGIKVAFRP